MVKKWWDKGKEAMNHLSASWESADDSIFVNVDRDKNISQVVIAPPTTSGFQFVYPLPMQGK